MASGHSGACEGEGLTEPVTFKYRAFISYSHRDASWAKWLHAALEGYRIDKDLVGRRTSAGLVPGVASTDLS